MSSDLFCYQLQRTTFGQLNAWQLKTSDAELWVAEQGAQILAYQRQGQPLIWLSDQAQGLPGQPVRGGVPLCWPWFGHLPRNPAAVQALHSNPTQAPAHGLVRDQPWHLQQVRQNDQTVHLVFELATPIMASDGQPLALKPRLTISLGERLMLELVTHNTGTQLLSFSQALHSYFAVSDIHAIHINGLEDCPYVDSLQNWTPHTQQGPVCFSAETDRLYLNTPSQLSIDDPGWQRRLYLDSQGSRSAVVWNPWIDKAQRLSQFADDAWQQMLCIETANVLDDICTLAPGEHTCLSLSIWSAPLSA